MRKKSITLLLFALLSSLAVAESLKVLSVSKPGIKVAGKVIKAGSVISSDAKLTWAPGKSNQTVKLIGSNGNILVLNSRYMSAKHATTIAQMIKHAGDGDRSNVDPNPNLLTDTKGLITREVKLLNDMQMREYFAKPIVLQDSLILQLPYNFDEQHVLFLQYDNNINKLLPGCGNTVTIDDRIFLLDGEPTAPVTRSYRLYYYDMIEGITTLIADSLVIDVDVRQK